MSTSHYWPCAKKYIKIHCMLTAETVDAASQNLKLKPCVGKKIILVMSEAAAVTGTLSNLGKEGG